MFSFLMLLIVGVAVGILGALLGIGGGIIMVPLLTFVFGFPVHISIATSLVVIMANSLSASSNHIKSGFLNIQLGILLSIFAIIGALISSSIALLLTESTLMVTIAIMQIIFAIIAYIKIKDNKKAVIGDSENVKKNTFSGSYFDASRNMQVNYTPIRIYLSSIAAFVSGIFAGISGAGGGALITPAMNAFSKVPLRVATSTSIFIIGFTAAAATLVFFIHGNVDARSACFIMLGVIAGTKLSVRFFSKVTDAWVSYLLIVLLLASAIKMLHGAAKLYGWL